MGFFHGKQSSMHCSSTGPSQGEVLSANPCQGPASSRHVSAPQVAGGSLLTMDFHGLQRDILLHHGLHHGLQGNPCSSMWSTTFPSFVTGLGVCTCFSLIFTLLSYSHSSLLCCSLLWSSSFPPATLNLLSQRLYHHGQWFGQVESILEPAGLGSVRHRAASGSFS